MNWHIYFFIFYVYPLLCSLSNIKTFCKLGKRHEQQSQTEEFIKHYAIKLALSKVENSFVQHLCSPANYILYFTSRKQTEFERNLPGNICFICRAWGSSSFKSDIGYLQRRWWLNEKLPVFSWEDFYTVSKSSGYWTSLNFEIELLQLNLHAFKQELS